MYRPTTPRILIWLQLQFFASRASEMSEYSEPTIKLQLSWFDTQESGRSRYKRDSKMYFIGHCAHDTLSTIETSHVHVFLHIATSINKVWKCHIKITMRELFENRKVHDY